MKVIRSWPRDPPEYHPRADDMIPRMLNSDFDYRKLIAYNDDILHVDWDTAVSPEDFSHFAEHARTDPLSCLVHPCVMYPGGMFGSQIRDHSAPERAGYRYVNNGTGCRHITEDDEACALWGFGMVYLPGKWLTAYGDAFPGQKLTDIGFSGWYYRQAGEARICWHVKPVHLNFPEIKEL